MQYVNWWLYEVSVLKVYFSFGHDNLKNNTRHQDNTKNQIIKPKHDITSHLKILVFSSFMH